MRADIHFGDVPPGQTQAAMAACGCFTNLSANWLSMDCIKSRFLLTHHRSEMRKDAERNVLFTALSCISYCFLAVKA